MAENETILSLRKVNKIYPIEDSLFYALKDINLEIFKYEFLSVLGPSGSGKSTLLNIIGGTDRATSGSVIFENHDLTTAAEKFLTNYRRENIGFIFQFYNLLPTLTASENVQVVSAIANNPLDPAEALAMVGIKHLATKFPAQMSGGEQQRVAIARAIASNPHILLCDEPTGALDSVNSEKVMTLLVDLCRHLRKTVVFLTHNRELTKVSDRIIELKDGRIV